MAVVFAVENTRVNEYNIFPEDIIVKAALNGRCDTPNIDWLIASICERGQDTPVVIRKDGNKPVLSSGFSRWRAVSEINKRKLLPKKIPLRCCYKNESEHEAFLGNIAENRFRNQTTAMDDAHNIKRMLHVYKMTEEEIAAVYFPADSSEQAKKDALKWVKDRAALISLTPEAEEALKGGRLKLPAAKAIAKLSEEQQREAVKGSGKVKARNIREASGKPKQASLRDLLSEAVDSGQVKVDGKSHDLPDFMVEWLGRLVEGKKAKAAKA